ncbi:histidine kinase [Zhouia sp. PK063]|uniref:tetratricopeptide repeat-containing sensor histidine kinase n=1 Tax=Zhouia sp. PK063 TaxID=3373602 RepID=UPI003795A835
MLNVSILIFEIENANYIFFYCMMQLFRFFAVTLCCFFVQILIAQHTKIAATKIDSLLKNGKIEVAENLLLNDSKELKKSHDTIGLAKCFLLLGKTKLVSSRFDEALDYYLKAKPYESYFTKLNKAELYTGLGIVYSRTNILNEAEINFKNALEIYKKNDTERLKILINLGGVYLEEKDRKVLVVYKEALLLCDILQKPNFKTVLFTNLSNYYLLQNNWRSAKANAQKSLGLSDSLHLPISVSTYNNLGYAFVQLKEPEKGILYYKKALPKADLLQQSQLYLNLKNAYRAKNDYQIALQYADSLVVIKDSIAAKQYQEKISALETAYNTKEKQKQITYLKQENVRKKKELTYLILGSLIALFFMVTIAILRAKNVRIKRDLEQSKLRQQFLQLQLNPHFIFNALQQIQFFIFSNKKEESMEYLSRFGKLMRTILENSDREFIHLSDEMDLLTNYLELQKGANENSFDYNIQLDVVNNDIKIPVMLLQPFLENAVVHGLKENNNGNILLVFKQNETTKYLEVQIIDNGRGFENKKANSNLKLHRSMATEIMQDRIKEFNSNNALKIELKVTKAFNDSIFPGTKICLKIPYVNA